MDEHQTDPDGTYEEYQSVIEMTEPLRDHDEVKQFSIRREVRDYNKRSRGFSSSRDLSKLRYYVVDNYEPEVLYVTRWDIPDDHHSDGRKELARGIIRGLKMDHNE